MNKNETSNFVHGSDGIGAKVLFSVKNCCIFFSPPRQNMYKNKNETSVSRLMNSYSKYLCRVKGLQKRTKAGT